MPPSDSEEETSSDDDDKKDKHKGVEGLIEVENPNRVAKKSVKARDIDVNAKVQLSRKERYITTYLLTTNGCCILHHVVSLNI